MWKQFLGLALMASTHLFAQNCWYYVPDGQTIYSEVCCPTELCPPECPEPCNIFPVLVVDLQAGIRRDSFSFTVQGPDGVPSTFIRQKYPKIKSGIAAVNVWYQYNRQLYFRGYADYANISHGKEKQTFYDANGDMALRYEEQSHSGHMYDFLGGFGWNLPCLPDWFTFAPAGGYSQEVQSIESNRAKLRTPAGNQGRVSGRHSKLQTNWYGPWAGVDMAIRYRGLKVGGTFEYHWATFHATEHQTAGGSCVNNCNTRNNFNAQGRGLVGVLSATQVFCNNWRFGFVGKLQYWKTRSGDYSFDGEKLRLNRFKWNSGSLVANIGYRF